MTKALVGRYTTIINSNCTIKAGVTLLLAYDSAGTRVTNAATLSTTQYIESAGRTLSSVITLNENVTLTIESGGTLEVAGQMVCGKIGSKYMGQTGGNYAELRMLANAKIVSNGTIKCTGYITEVSYNLITSNGEIYMPFVIKDFRGGSYMYAAYNKKVQPFNQYQLLNITVPIKINYGSKVIGYANVEIDDAVQSATINFVGTTTDYVYQLTTSNSYIEMDTTVGITYLKFYGGMKLNALKMDVKISLISMTMSSESMHLPIPWSFDITLCNGTYDFTAQDIKLFPGARLNVASGATLNAGDIIVYESFNDTAHLSTVAYPTDKGVAKLTVNGTLTCSRLAGPAHSTINGAKITINNTGASNFNSTEATGTISGLGGILATIETKTITHTTTLYCGTGTNYVTHTYTTNTPVTYTRTSSGWTIS